MAFKKIPKEVWDKMSFNDQNYWKLEFERTVEQRTKQTVLVTRIVAVFLIFALFFIGIAQMRAVSDYNKIKDTYGPGAYCYLCGLENYKKCECQYFSDINDVLLDDLPAYALSLAEYNVEKCDSMVLQDGSYEYGGINVPINLSLLDDPK